MFSVAASPEQRDKSELIERFLEIAGFGEADAQFDIDPAAPEPERNWRKFVADSMEDEMSGIIEAEKLKAEPTRDLMRGAFEVGGVPQEGTAVTRVMPPGSRFGARAEARDRQRHRVADLLSGFYRKYRSLTAHYPIELPED